MIIFSKIEGICSELHLGYPFENISNIFWDFVRHTEDLGGPKEDPVTEKPKEEPNPLSWRLWGRPWKRLVELKADLAKQFPKKKYWDKNQILRQYESMT